jgi:ATP-dependent protease ClpP protease subunit
VVIVSGGGQYGEGVRLMNVINSVPNTTVICKYCASAAGMVFGASTSRRLVIQKSELIMHEMFMDHITANMMGPNLANSLKKSSDEFNQIMYSKIGMSKADYEKKILNTEWILDGIDIVKFHLADEFVRLDCDDILKYILKDTCSE